MHPNENIVDVCYDIAVIDKKTDKISRINEVHSMRYYFKPEMEEYLEKAGFKNIKCIDCNTFKEPDFGSWTVYFVAER